MDRQHVGIDLHRRRSMIYRMNGAGGDKLACVRIDNDPERRVKNDEHGASDLADLLRLGRLAEAWIASEEIRELRELLGRAATAVCGSGGSATGSARVGRKVTIGRRGDGERRT